MPATGLTMTSFLLSWLSVEEMLPNAAWNSVVEAAPARATACACSSRSARALRSASWRAVRSSARWLAARVEVRIARRFSVSTSQKLLLDLLSTVVDELLPVCALPPAAPTAPLPVLAICAATPMLEVVLRDRLT